MLRRKAFLLLTDSQLLQHHLLKRLPFFHWITFASLLNFSWAYMGGFISEIVTLSYEFMFLFLCQFHTALIPGAISLTSASGRVLLPLHYCIWNCLRNSRFYLNNFRVYLPTNSSAHQTTKYLCYSDSNCIK